MIEEVEQWQQVAEKWDTVGTEQYPEPEGMGDSPAGIRTAQAGGELGRYFECQGMEEEVPVEWKAAAALWCLGRLI